MHLLFSSAETAMTRDDFISKFEKCKTEMYKLKNHTSQFMRQVARNLESRYSNLESINQQKDYYYLK